MIGQQLAKSWAPAIRQGLAKRGVSTISGPPQRPMAFAEKMGYFAVMFAGWTFVPVWVLAHLREYKGVK